MGRPGRVSVTTQASRPAPAPARRRPVPERCAEFAHLTLDGLRAYRQALNAEEGRVSYWRRIIQARLDLVRATEQGGGGVDSLRGVFGDQRIDGGRLALLRVVPVDDIPPLPELGDLWHRQPRPGEAEHNARLMHDLTRAEKQLSAYRAALHRRIAAATGELIARYREDPLQCLSALPAERRATPRAAGA